MVHTSKGGRDPSRVESRFVRCRESPQRGEGVESGDSWRADGLKPRDGSHRELGHCVVEPASQKWARSRIRRDDVQLIDLMKGSVTCCESSAPVKQMQTLRDWESRGGKCVWQRYRRCSSPDGGN